MKKLKSYEKNSRGCKADWDTVISSRTVWYDIDLKGVWQYRDLIFLFVRRDFVTQYKQTVLGPLWMLIQPLLTTLMFSVIFGRIANIPTGGSPRILFYLAAFVPWTFFTECFNKNAATFSSNAGIFGKVYFPRLVRPVSVIISSFYKFIIQFFLFVIIYAIFVWKGSHIEPTKMFWMLPILLIFPALFGFSLGLIVSSFTTKYKDLNFVTAVIIQLLMYGSSVVFSISDISTPYKAILAWNPLVWVIEAFRYATLGIGTWSWYGLGYAAIWMSALLFIAVIIFNRVEKSFMDTI
jgi:lipopolysaccharide transport system permease protein